MDNDKLQNLNDILIQHWINRYISINIVIDTDTEFKYSILHTNIFSNDKSFEVFSIHTMVGDNMILVSIGKNHNVLSNIPINDFKDEISKLKKYLEIYYNEYWNDSVEAKLSKQLSDIVKGNFYNLIWNSNIEFSKKDFKDYKDFETYKSILKTVEYFKCH